MTVSNNRDRHSTHIITSTNYQNDPFVNLFTNKYIVYKPKEENNQRHIRHHIQITATALRRFVYQQQQKQSSKLKKNKKIFDQTKWEIGVYTNNT
jgi:hypothetical protein